MAKALMENVVDIEEFHRVPNEHFGLS